MMPGNWLILLGVIAMSFFGGWEVQGWRRDSQEKDRVENQAEVDRLAHAASVKRVDAVIAAQNAAVGRAAAAQRDALDARSELERLQSLSDSAVAAARASHQACIDNSAALSDVFKSCTGRYADLAKTADGHANDAKTLSDAWPK